MTHIPHGCARLSSSGKVDHSLHRPAVPRNTGDSLQLLEHFERFRLENRLPFGGQNTHHDIISSTMMILTMMIIIIMIIS